MKIFFSFGFIVPKAINELGEVYFRKEAPLFPSFPPTGMTVKISDPDGELRWYKLIGIELEEDGRTWSDIAVAKLMEDDIQDPDEQLDKLFASSDEETVRKARLYIEHLMANGWEQQPDLP